MYNLRMCPRKPGQMYAPRLVVALLLLLAGFITGYSQALSIEMSWDGNDFDGFEGGLVMPRSRGAEEDVLRSLMDGSSADGLVKVKGALIGGSAIWTASTLKQGWYQFYVTSLGSVQGLMKPVDFSVDGLRVRIRTAAGTQVIEGPRKLGAIWHVCDVDGTTGEIVVSGDVLPAKTVVYGFVQDAVTGNGVPAAEVSLKHKATGQILRRTTNADGKFLVPADFGSWNISVQHDAYIDWNDTLAFIKSEYPIRIDAHMSPLMTDAQYRFVLSWGASPPDLDAHVVGPTPAGGEFHISYRTMRTWERRHFLDRDDTNGYGPETITLEKLDPGVYTFAVQNYTNKNSAGSNRLSHSKAVVRVYREDKMIGEAFIREGQPGTVWRVFTLDGRTGRLELVDAYLNESNPERVR
jgi:uncharacterized protein YfaP (DUF2135 family)